MKNCYRKYIPYSMYQTEIMLCWVMCWLYKARHAHKRLYTVLPKYSKIHKKHTQSHRQLAGKTHKQK